MIVENENEKPTVVTELSDNETHVINLNQNTKQRIDKMQLPTAETSKGRLNDTEEPKFQVTEKRSKGQSRNKVEFLDKDPTNTEVKTTNLKINKNHIKTVDKDKQKLVFKKKEGTAQVSGQLYETNMLTFIHLGATFDQDITKFYLASNIDDIGALDDICFRFKSNDNNKDVLVFIQTKHRNKISEKTNITMNDVQKSDGDYCIKKYLNSSFKIREKITSNKVQNYMFEGDSMNKLDCHYVIYTPAGHSINNSCIKLVKPSDKVNALIETEKEGVVFQFKYEHVGFLLHDLIEKRFEELAKKFLDMILNENMDMVDDELIENYRTVLLNYVIDICDDMSQGFYKSRFRIEFFESNEMYTIMFREKLYKEMIHNELNKFVKARENLLSTHEASIAKNIVKDIGNILRYDDKGNQFILINDSLKNYGSFDQAEEEAKATSAKDIVEMAGKELLISKEFKIPVTLVDTDMKVTKLRRFEFLTGSLIKLFENAKDQNGVKLIEIDENFLDANKIKSSVFDQNGGLGSAVGNLLIIDQESKTFKFNNENLPPNAKMLWEALNLNESLINIKEDLTTYRLKVCIQGFPKVSLEDIVSDEYIVKEFISKLWFYTGQAKHDSVEVTTKKMIKKHLKADSVPESIFEVSPDAVYLMLHKYIEKWWESEKPKEYLTESTNIIDKTISQLVKNPILTVLNLFCVNTLKTVGIEFNQDAIKSLNVEEFISGLLMIITDSTILTGAKLKQHFDDPQNHRFINFNDVVNHFLISFEDFLHELEPTTEESETTTEELDTITEELDTITEELDTITDESQTTIETIIIICETMENSRYSIQALKRLKQKMYDRKMIIISSKRTHEEINKDMKCIDLRSDSIGLCDLTLESQEKVLNESIVVFQGVEVNLKTIIDSNSKHIITSNILNKLVMKEVFELGNALTTSNYDDIKKFYVQRSLECPCDEFEDLNEVAICGDNSKEQINENKLNNSIIENGNTSKQSNLRSKVKIILETKHLLEDINDDDVMVITAPPGMGKSTLLTHLSIETKKEYPNVWIARINLQDFSKQFHEWKQKKTVINKIITLMFLCKAVTNGHENEDMEFSIENNEIVLKTDNFRDSLELRYFIHCCNTGNVIFLFDGFDEICPHYETVGIQLIKSTIKLNVIEATTSSAEVIKRPKIWIASRAYNDVLKSIEREFGKSYNLQPISDVQQRIYLKAFWKEHLKLDKFTNEQLVNVNAFIEYTANFIYNHRNRTNFTFYIKPISIPLYDMYAIAADFFINEISSIPHLERNEMFKNTLNLDRSLFYDGSYRNFKSDDDVIQASMLAGTPLHLHIAADYFQNEIKYSDSNNEPTKWNIDMNTFSFYDRFLTTKFTKIRFENKNKIDVYIPDNEMTHDSAYEIFVENHQKLAFYAIFSNYESNFRAVITKNELDDIKALVNGIKLAKEKTGVIDCVVNDVPVFIHRTFAEYFAIQHICIKLKTAYSYNNLERQETIWKFILDVVIRDGTEGTNAIFNHLLVTDIELLDIISSEDTERIVYDIISDQIMTLDPDQDETAINKAVYCGLRETSRFLFTCIKKQMKDDFFDQLYRYARESSLVEYSYLLGYDDVHGLLTDILKMDYELVQTFLSRYIWMARPFKFGPFKKG